MRKNRKCSNRMSVVAERSMHVGAVLFAAFVMTIVNLLASSSGSQLERSNGEKEKQIARLGEDVVRESARWEEMMSVRQLESALLKFGLSMKYARPDQVVRIRADGRPYANQLSLARLSRDGGLRMTAQNVRTKAGRRR